MPTNAPFAGVSIRTQNDATIHLPNRIFTCTDTGQQFQCQADIQKRTLALNLTQGIDYQYDLTDCQAQYDGQPVSCEESGVTFAPILSETYEITDMALNPQQQKALQQRYRGINTLMRLGEVRLLRMSMGLSLVAGIGAAFFAWLHPELSLSKAFASVAAGFGIHQLVLQFLGQIPYNAVTPYGLKPEIWDWVVTSAAITVGITAAIATALLLWQRLHGPTQILVRLMSSVGIFVLCWLSFNFSFMFGLNVTGMVVFESLIMWSAAAVSIIFAIAAASLLWSHTYQSIKRFLSLSSGFGAVALTSYFFVYLLLGLGYAD
ncbi:MAG: hypothetical protein F6J95_015450 [Leptolyngbya sp. SIO1E4]|nr:hypothetical protein [Leptolyngbya sp. SIO1E4]